MFNWFKREPPAKAPARAPAKSVSPTQARQRPRRPDPAAPLPLPEVVAEGSTEADWSAWEDSVTTLDSQMQGLMPSTRIYVREEQQTRPGQLEEADPFAKVSKRDL